VDRDRDETPPKHDDAIKSTIEPPLDLGPDLRPGHFLFSAAIGSGGFSAVAGPMHAMSLAPALVAARSATI
jgi:hypothetical protein